MKKPIFLFFLIGTVFLINNCASVGSTQGYASTIEEAHPDRFEKTVIGMDINEFKTVWPEATRSSLSADGETYEFIYTRLAPGGYGYTYKIFTYFYFANNVLIKYESQQKTF